MRSKHRIHPDTSSRRKSTRANIWLMLVCILCSFSLGFFACQDSLSPDEEEAIYQLILPTGFPEPVIPEDNQLTQARIDLGKRLFNDPILSRDSSISCASCHKRAAGMADDLAISPGIKGRLGFRNAPTLANVAYHPYFFKEGGSPTLEMQMLGPIEDENEMGFNAAELAQRLLGHPFYDSLALAAYNRPMDLFVLTRAIASFERTLISGDSPYDRYTTGDSAAMSEAAIRGMNLFFSETTNCASCHDGHDFSTYDIHNNGLYAEYADLGRYRVSLDSADIGKFKVPTLRNIAATAPYMHDGSLPDLASVIRHYNHGGQGHANQHELIRPLNLSQQEQEDIIEFLHHLSDEAFLTAR